METVCSPSPRVTFIWELVGLAPSEERTRCACLYFPAPSLNTDRGFDTRALHEDLTMPEFCRSTLQLSTKAYIGDNSEQKKQMIRTNSILVCDVAVTVPSA